MLEGWIDINHFAEKYGVSVSTLRRRIRSHSVEFKLEKGRYLLPDKAQALGSAPLFSRQLVQQRTLPVATKAQPRSEAVFNDLADPVRDFLACDEILPVTLVSDLEALKKENRKLKSQVAELETYIKALEAEVESK